MTKKEQLIAASVAGLMAVLAAGAGVQAAEESTVKCYGVNKCKGTGQCGGKKTSGCGGKKKGNSCAGKNSCKGKGWVRVAKGTCLEVMHGRLKA